MEFGWQLLSWVQWLYKKPTAVAPVETKEPSWHELPSILRAIIWSYATRIEFKDLRMIPNKDDEKTTLNFPQGLCIKQDQVFVADTYNYRVQVFHTITGHFLFELKLPNDQEFHVPISVAVDEMHNRIFIVIRDLGIKTYRLSDMTFVGNVKDYDTESRPTYGAHPHSIQVFNKELYVSEQYCSRINVLSEDGKECYVRRIEICGEKEGEFWGPCGMFLDQDTSELFVADRDNCRVQVFDAKSGLFIRQYGKKKLPSSYDDLFGRTCPRQDLFSRINIPHVCTGPESLCCPVSVVVHGDQVIVASSKRRQVYDSNLYVFDRNDCQFRESWGTGKLEYVLDMALHSPKNELFLCDGKKNRIFVVQ